MSKIDVLDERIRNQAETLEALTASVKSLSGRLLTLALSIAGSAVIFAFGAFELAK